MWPFSRKEQTAAAFEIGPNGRPIRPRFDGFEQQDEIGPKPRQEALAWAAVWLDEKPDMERADAVLVQLIAYDRSGVDGSIEAQVAEVARLALRSALEDRKILRTARALPFAQFKIRGQLAPCQAARELDGTLFSALSTPTVPLPQCDARLCRCGIEQISRREHDRIAAARAAGETG